jgi:uncharacterized protein with FMN-binding domain
MRKAPIILTTTIAGVAAAIAYHPQARVPLPLLNTPAVTQTVAGSTVVTGAAAPNRYGTVQVRVTARDGKILDITPIQLPQGDSRSAQISTTAGPQLAQQALAAQSAHIDGVSGASYTSASYEQSLQSAIDQLPAAAASAAGAPA